MGTRVENAADSHKISVPVARILDRCRMERAPEAQMQMPEKAESCDRQLAIQSHADLTVVSGYLECFSATDHARRARDRSADLGDIAVATQPPSEPEHLGPEHSPWLLISRSSGPLRRWLQPCGARLFTRPVVLLASVYLLLSMLWVGHFQIGYVWACSAQTTFGLLDEYWISAPVWMSR